MTDNELLLAISDILDKKLKPIDERFNKMESNFDEKLRRMEAKFDERLTRIELIQENDILPRLQNIEACYTSTYERYQAGVEHMEAMRADIDVMKHVLLEHSDKLQKIS